MSELWKKSALTLAAMIRIGEVTSREVVQAHLERIEAVNPALNTIVEGRPDEVLAEADRANVAQREGRALGMLHGVPFTVKTNVDLAGYHTTQGAVRLKDLLATRDAPTVERMRAAGGVPLARTNMPDAGRRITPTPPLRGPCHNPWRSGYTAGGSSGGEGAALAAGMTPIGLGNDIGGSVRNPAFCNGVASIKPSRGRIPGGNWSDMMDPALNTQLMNTQGIMARTVGDVRAGLEAVMGAHVRDPESHDAPYHGRPVAKRAALVTAPSGGSTHPDVSAGVALAGEALEAAGYDVVEVEPPLLVDSFFSWAELMWSTIAVQKPLLDAVMGDDARLFLDLTNAEIPAYTQEMSVAMHQTRYKVARAWREFFMEFPVIVGPTWTQPPFAHGYDIESKESALSVVELFRFVLPANLLGLPAACVPTKVINGFPMGAQIIGDRFREDTCLEAAAAVEAACGILTPIDPRP